MWRLLAVVAVSSGCYEAQLAPVPPDPDLSSSLPITLGAPVPLFVGFGPSLSADGRYLVFASRHDLTGSGGGLDGARIYRFDDRSGELLHVSEGLDPRLLHAEPTISGSGHRIAFRSADGLRMQQSVWEQGADEARPVAECPPSDTYLVVGVRVLANGSGTVCAAQGVDLRIRRIEWAGGTSELRRIELVPGAPSYTFGSPAASADGAVVGFNQPGVRLLEGSTFVEVPVPDFSILASGALSRSGRYAAVQVDEEGDWRLVVFDRETGAVVDTGVVVGAWGTDVAISGDGRRIAFAGVVSDGVQIGVLDVATREVAWVDHVPAGAGATTGVALSADGQTLVYAGVDSMLTRVSL
jgi:hypothetical protein